LPDAELPRDQIAAALLVSLAGEIHDVMQVLPEDIRALWAPLNDAAASGR
jgi:hypothetical protein